MSDGSRIATGVLVIAALGFIAFEWLTMAAVVVVAMSLSTAAAAAVGMAGTADQQAMQTVLWSVGIRAATGDRQRAGGGNA